MIDRLPDGAPAGIVTLANSEPLTYVLNLHPVQKPDPVNVNSYQEFPSQPVLAGQNTTVGVTAVIDGAVCASTELRKAEKASSNPRKARCLKRTMVRPPE